jgi:hypothetical protein
MAKSSKKLPATLKSKWKVKAPLYITKKDKRYKRYAAQLKKSGFSDTETWALDSVISAFILPRLIRFKKITNCYPGDPLTEKDWDAILDDMIFAFNWNLTLDEKYFTLSKDEQKLGNERYERGMNFFAKYFNHLGW